MNITAAIHMHARLRPHSPAVIAPARSLNFAQLDAAIWGAAAHFKAEGLEAGQTVVVDIQDSGKHLIVALALARIGVAHLAKPLRQNASVMVPLAARVGAVRTIVEADAADDILFSKEEVKRESVSAIAAAMMQYGALPWIYATSSATTGRAKIVEITQRMTLQRSDRFAAGIPTLVSDRFLSLSELAFQASKVRAAGVLNVGGSVVFPDGLNLESVLDFIRRTRVTRIKCAPVHLHWLCGQMHEAMLLPELRVLEVGGSTVTGKLRGRVRQKVCANLYVRYSATETGVVTVAPPEIDLPDTVGAALPGVHLQIVDAADKPLPRGEIGLIRLRAPGTAERYHDDEEATAKAFRDGWFYPGDLGALTEDEQLIFKGRADDMMIFDGINIYPAEIEAVLAAHEAVGEAAAFALHSEVHQDIPVAAVTLRAPVAEADLLVFCRARLGARAPQRIVVVEAFPRNPTGKILKRELAKLLQRTPVAERDSQAGAAEESIVIETSPAAGGAGG